MKAKNRIKYRAVTAILSVAAVGLLAFGSVGGARAALTYSETYTSEFATQDIGVSLTEDNKPIADKAPLLSNLTKGEQFHVGQKYAYTLGAQNTGTIEEYVRITVRKYWIKSDDKQRGLEPNQINLEINEDDWYVVDEDPDDEIVVLYYTEPIAKGDPTTDAIKSLMVDGTEVLKATKTQSGKVITTTYQYDGVSIGLEAEADAVQTHNAHDAILSAWGVDVSFDGDTITDVK